MKKIINKKNLYIAGIGLFAILFFCYPISFFIKYRLHDFLYPGILALVICSVLAIILRFTKLKKIFEYKYTILIIVLLALGLRIGSVFYFRNMEQISDFLRAYNTAENLEFLPYHRLFTHWILLPEILHVVFSIFGKSQIVLGIFNSVVSALTCLVIYCVSNKIFNNRKVSLLCSFIYAIMPSSILYINVCTNEHFASLFICLSILGLLYAADDKLNYKKRIILGILSGISLCLADNFKPFSLVIIVAIIIMVILKYLKEHYTGKEILKSLSLVLLIVLSFFASKTLMFKCYDHLMKAPVSRGATSWTLMMGLSKESKGVYSSNRSDYYYAKLDKYDWDFKKVDKEVFADLKKDIKSNYKNLIMNTMPEKIRTGIIKDTDISYWMSVMTKSPKIKKQFEQHIWHFLDYFYCITIIFTVIGLINLVIKNNDNMSFKMFFLYLIIFGFFLLTLLTEIQDRYKYPFMPLLIIMAGYGIYVSVYYVKKFLETQLVRK